MSRLTARDVALSRRSLPPLSKLLLEDPIIQNALRRVCLNPFKKTLPRFDPRYTLTFDGASFRDHYDKQVADMKNLSAPLPEPEFYYAEWFETEEEAVERLDFVKKTFLYSTHSLRHYEDIERFLLEITF